MRETVGECFSRLSKALKLTIAEKKVARICDLRGRPLRSVRFHGQARAAQQLYVIIAAGERDGNVCAPPLPPLEPGRRA